MLQHCNLTIAGKAVTVSLANLVWDLTDVSTLPDVSGFPRLVQLHDSCTSPVTILHLVDFLETTPSGVLFGTNFIWWVIWNHYMQVENITKC